MVSRLKMAHLSQKARRIPRGTDIPPFKKGWAMSRGTLEHFKITRARNINHFYNHPVFGVFQ